MEATNLSAGSYQLRLALHGISPPIWRRLRVPAAYSLADLHGLIQWLMGWEDEYLHRFRIRGRDFSVYKPGGLLFAADGRLARLSDLSLRHHERFTYTYNFYAEWVFDIRVEQHLGAADSQPYPVCLGGVGAGPPEDCLNAEQFMQQQDGHHPLWLVERARELLEADDLETLREEVDDWPRWLQPQRIDRRTLNRQLQRWRPGQPLSTHNEEPCP